MTLTVAIIQARMTSTRLPGKVMMTLDGRTVLWHVLTRCRAIAGVDAVCCAIPTASTSDVLVAESERAGAVVFRGDEKDVLDRYAKAAAWLQADVVLRVTSDCPLIDPAVCADVLALRARQDAGYACNNMPASFPHGLDCEAMTAPLLHRAAATAQAAGEREHVSEWLRNNPSVKRANLLNPRGDQHAMRWTLDYPEDLAFFQAVFARLPGTPDTDAVLALLAREPRLAELNRGRAG